jgi:hypothetical protein
METFNQLASLKKGFECVVVDEIVDIPKSLCGGISQQHF